MKNIDLLIPESIVLLSFDTYSRIALITSIDKSVERLRIRYKFLNANDDIAMDSIYLDEAADILYKSWKSKNKLDIEVSRVDESDDWNKYIWKLKNQRFPVIDSATYIDRRENPSWIYVTPIIPSRNKSVGGEVIVWYLDDIKCKEDSLGNIWEINLDNGKVRMNSMKKTLNYNR